MKRILMTAFHFPPIQGSSGMQRTLRFARYLPEFGWKPIILSAHPRAYEQTATDQLDDIPPGIEIVRAQAWDTARHLSIAGRYPGVLARPDRWLTWWLGAVPAGMKLIREFKPAAIWSTYPIATAHRIGATLHARSGLPWIADFRDPMAQDGYPEDPATWRSFARIEAHAIKHAALSTFTTPSAVAHYRQRYPERADRLQLLENGYDEETFANAAGGHALNPGKRTLLHSGIVYPSERDPTQLFAALALLRERSPDVYAGLRIRFRAAVHDELLHKLAGQHNVADAIETLPPVAYRDALSEMLRADALLVLQANNCNAHVPAKLYEYFRARRPIIALTDPAGDTGLTCRDAGITAIAPLDSAQAIAECLARYAVSPTQGTLATDSTIEAASRRGRTRDLARMLDDVTASARA
ncbi:MAG: glycosyltransferase [Azoarcus sp.]|nr:MAG: glycosyltransferase [Azoarcus sp.]